MKKQLILTAVAILALTACSQARFGTGPKSASTALSSASSGDVTEPQIPQDPNSLTNSSLPACTQGNYINGDFYSAGANGTTTFLQELNRYGVGIDGCGNVASQIVGTKYPDHYIQITGDNNTVNDATAPSISGYTGSWISVNGESNTLAHVSGHAFSMIVNGSKLSVDLSGASDLLARMDSVAIAHNGDPDAVNTFAGLVVNGTNIKVCVSGLEKVLEHKFAEGVYIYGAVSLNTGNVAVPGGGTKPQIQLVVNGSNVDLCD